MWKTDDDAWMLLSWLDHFVDDGDVMTMQQHIATAVDVIEEAKTFSTSSLLQTYKSRVIDVFSSFSTLVHFERDQGMDRHR